MAAVALLTAAVAAVLLPVCLVLWRSVGRSWWQKQQRLIHYARVLPGPRPFPLIGNVLDVGFKMSNLVPTLFSLRKKYGSIIRLWLGPILIVNITDPRDLEVLLSSVKYIEKSYFYKFAHAWLGKGLLTSSGTRWHQRRKVITPTFHFKILDQFVDVFNKQGNIFVSNMKKNFGKGLFDVCDIVDLYTEDIICETAMGVQLNAQTDENKVSEYLSAVKSQEDIMIKRLFSPWLYNDTIYKLFPISWKERRNLKILHGMTKKVIADRRKSLKEDPITINENTVEDLGKKRRLAFLDLLLFSSDNNVLSDEDIQEEVDTFMFEGHDTTSSAICFALYELSKHPEIQERIYEELKETNFEDEINLSMDALNSLKYTEMVIKETLRLYPSVPMYGRLLLEDMPLVSRNEIIPSGVEMNVAPFALHRNAEYFPDPETFDPDRFLPDVSQKRHPFAYFPFSAGPRNCIGQKFAMLEMKSIISKIIWNFNLQTDPEFKVSLQYYTTLKSGNGVQLSVYPRERK